MKLLRNTSFTFLISFFSYSQCAMCRAVLENESDTSTAEGINNGIIYLMSIPYILVIILGYFIYRTYKRKFS